MKQDSMTGLSTAEVTKRLEQGLVNTSSEKITKSNIQIIRDHVLTLFNLLNLLIGICLVMVGAFSNMFYLVIILMNIMIGIYQEIHAKRLVENLSILAADKVVVIRNGQKEAVAADQVVQDDLMYLALGNQVSADAVVVSGTVEVNEALLTGEADPITKSSGMSLLSGSYIISGACYAQVEHVGKSNFAEQLTKEAKQHKQINSELLRSMQKVTKFTSFFILPIGLLLFAQAYFWRSAQLQTAVVSTAAALLGMLPKGLVLLISISLAAGVIKLSQKKILVQQMYSIETLAHVDVLCLDKTGTITEGAMKVTAVHPINPQAFSIPLEMAMARFSSVMPDNNATFSALQDYFPADRSANATSVIAFSSERKWSSATFDDIGTIIVGAPDKLIPTQMKNLPKEVQQAQLAGKRLLCIGRLTGAAEQQMLGQFGRHEIGSQLPPVTLVAMVVINDPVRPNARETLAFFRQEGVAVKIISGDNPLTVSAIARQAGLEDYDSYLDLSQVKSEADLVVAANQYSIFGRVMPEQKSKLIKALQASGHTVGMVGDGVNDVMALKQADLSAAMAAGSEAAKQVSQLVLLESDFASLTDVVLEGRRVVNNITRVAGIFFVKTIYSVLLSMICLLVSMPFPFIPIQVTLIDLALEAYAPFFLSFEPIHEQIKGSFLETVFQRALPKALLVILNIVMVTAVARTIPAAERGTMIYCLTAFVTILAIAKVCYPPTKLRLFLWLTAAVGFYVAVYLFAGLLHVVPLSPAALKTIVALAAVDIILNLLLTKWMDLLFAKRRAADDII